MNVKDVKVGRVYRARRDSPSVANGRRYPKMAMEKFLRWAASDITDDLPNGEWADWPVRTANGNE